MEFSGTTTAAATTHASMKRLIVTRAAWAAFARRLYYAPLRATILSRLCERLKVSTS
jgi:hypothetical protein